MATKSSVKSLLLACGAVAAFAGHASAQVSPPPYLINLSGATLLQNFLRAPASTNDFVDVNNNGIVTPNPASQLAPFGITVPFPVSQWWQVQYRAVGSVNGLTELISYGRTYAVGANGVEIAASAAADGASNNRTLYVTAGIPGAGSNAANPGAAPARSLSDGSFRVTVSSSDPLTTGILIDAAPIDVPTTWAVIAPTAGTPDPTRLPLQGGYGDNPLIALTKTGTPTVPPESNKLAALGTANLNVASPNADTIYDTKIAVAPIAIVTNLGTGVRQLNISDVRHLNSAGRLPTGENLMWVTRDSGSGTRNAFCNTTCTDPSWGSGENVGGFSNTAALDTIGASWQPSNKGGQGRVELTVQNHRLAIGYAGAERGVTQGWLTNGRMEVVAVRNDLAGGTLFVRPTISNILNNSGANSYRIIGPAIYATFGDPRAEPAGYPGFGDGNSNPRMRNLHAAAYLNNITRSAAAFVTAPGTDPATTFSPGELLATQLILPQALDALPDSTNPCSFVSNAGFNANLKTFTLANNTLSNAAYVNFNTNANGVVPTRATGVTYTDGVANGANYVSEGGTAVTYGTTMNSGALLAIGQRNKISGDFNNDGARDWNDIPGMIAAWRDRNGGPAIVGDNNLVIEIIGDFNGDGNFNAADVRYFADGLAVDPTTRVLNRREGFTRVDTAFGGNFFGTTLATPKVYAAGDSRGDVSGPGPNRWTPNFAPVGFDGVVDALDINYVRRNFGDWTNISNAGRMDLSCDITDAFGSSLKVDAEDVTGLVVNILGTTYGDVNLDGAVNAADLAIANANPGSTGGWAVGDMNGDGVVNLADVNFIKARICGGDVDGNGVVQFTDLNFLLSNFGSRGQALPGDINGDGVVNFNDLNILLSNFGNNC